MTAIDDIAEEYRPGDYSNEPNSRYSTDVSNLGTWTSISDVDKFFSKYNHDNGYKSAIKPLRLGDYVTIKDGTYNVIWMIAGFDMEAERIAADGTTYNNGYGICMIPKTCATYTTWNSSATLSGAYRSSTMHNTHLPTLVNNLRNVLGSHIVQRNVLLSSSIDSGYHSSAYTWTKAYATLMSVGQMTGTFSTNYTKYDDGEANYKLPVFDHIGYGCGVSFWTRAVWGYANTRYGAYRINSDGGIEGGYYVGVNSSDYVRPLIYLR